MNRHVKHYSQRFISEFIDLYRSLPSLWNLKGKEYSDRNQKHIDYQILIAKLREVDPDADREMVKKKINSLRTSYRKERKKIEDFLRAGISEEDIRTPTLWYYDKFTFLNDLESSDQVLANTESSVSHKFNLLESSPTSSQSLTRRPSVTSIPSPSHRQEPSPKPLPSSIQMPVLKINEEQQCVENSIQKARKRKIIHPDTNEVMEICKLALRAEPNQSEVSEYWAIGVNVTKKLQRMEPTQAIYAESLIYDVLRKGLLQKLNDQSYVSDSKEILDTRVYGHQSEIRTAATSSSLMAANHSTNIHKYQHISDSNCSSEIFVKDEEDISNQSCEYDPL